MSIVLAMNMFLTWGKQKSKKYTFFFLLDRRYRNRQLKKRREARPGMCRVLEPYRESNGLSHTGNSFRMDRMPSGGRFSNEEAPSRGTNWVRPHHWFIIPMFMVSLYVAYHKTLCEHVACMPSNCCCIRTGFEEIANSMKVPGTVLYITAHRLLQICEFIFPLLHDHEQQVSNEVRINSRYNIIISGIRQ